jgi:hypothetical protein
VEWNLEWLYTLPVPSSVLFLARAVEFAATNVFGWFMTFPLLLVLLLAHGHRIGAVPAALAATAAVNVVIGAMRVLIETAVRMAVPLPRLKNLQAVFTVAGTGALFVVLASVFPSAAQQSVLDRLADLPSWARWNPLSLPVLLCAGGRVPWLAAAALGGWLVGAVTVAVLVCARLVQAGSSSRRPRIRERDARLRRRRARGCSAAWWPRTRGCSSATATSRSRRWWCPG